MTPACSTARHAIEADAAELSAEIQTHLSECAECRTHAAVVCSLASLSPAPADDGAVAQIIAALPPARWQYRRVATWLPLAAALALVAVGLLLLGGVPAGSFVAAIPSAASGVLGWIGTWALDTMVVARGSADAVRAAVSVAGAWLVIWLMVVALGGGWVASALARRRRTGL